MKNVKFLLSAACALFAVAAMVGTTEKRPPPAKSKGSGHTACPFFQVSSAYSKQKRCFSYRTTLCVFLSSKSAGFYSELPNLTENPPLSRPCPPDAYSPARGKPHK